MMMPDPPSTTPRHTGTPFNNSTIAHLERHDEEESEEADDDAEFGEEGGRHKVAVADGGNLGGGVRVWRRRGEPVGGRERKMIRGRHNLAASPCLTAVTYTGWA